MLVSSVTILALAATAAASPVSPWEAIHDQRSCASRGYEWQGQYNRCVARKENRQNYRDFRDERGCASHGYRWDARHGCGPLSGPYKREEETAAQVSPWEAIHDARVCANRGYEWQGQVNRCIARKEARQSYGDYRDAASCASHGYRWDVRHGCGPLSGLAGTLPRPYKRDTETTETTEQYPAYRPGPWDSWRDRNACERHAYRWDAVSNRCAEVAIANAAGNIAGAIAGGAAAALSGGIAGAFNAYTTEAECAAHSYRWDREHRRCN